MVCRIALIVSRGDVFGAEMGGSLILAIWAIGPPLSSLFPSCATFTSMAGANVTRCIFRLRIALVHIVGFICIYPNYRHMRTTKCSKKREKKSTDPSTKPNRNT